MRVFFKVRLSQVDLLKSKVEPRYNLIAGYKLLLYSSSQTPGRIQKVDPPILDSNTPMVEILEHEGGSTFWIRPGVQVVVRCKGPKDHRSFRSSEIMVSRRRLLLGLRTDM